MGIGKYLQSLLDQKGIKPNELATNLQISPSTIYSIIKRDNMKANIDDLYRISQYLGVSLDYFYNGIDSSNLTPDQQKKQLITNYELLNEEGREKLLEQSEFLVASGKYKRNIKNNPSNLGKEA